ncbi:MAG: FliG C-terminal domain-containing protein [Elusimicrobia bacterium]|nr:FliG C-terminal domain-containing protein [Elusimicrobiota bacterium]
MINILLKQKNRNWKISAIIFLLLASCFMIHDFSHGVDNNIDREKLTLETNIEKRITEALSKLLSSQDFIVIVNIEPIVEQAGNLKAGEQMQIEQLQVQEPRKTTKDYILPGVPTKKNLGEQENIQQSPVQVIMPSANRESDVLRQFIKKITIIIKFDKNVPEGIVSEAKKVITGLVDINVDRGDTLLVEKTEFYKKQTYWWQAFLNLQSMIWFMGIMLFAFFLFGPLNIFFKHLLRTLAVKPPPTQLQMPENMVNRQPQQQSSGGGGGMSGNLIMSLDDSKSVRPSLFPFISEGNIKNLAYLLKDETPDRIALVLSYLRRDWASFVMSQLAPEIQARVAMELVNVKQLEPDDVEMMELELKKKIDYLIGGTAQVIELCERSDKKTRENILSSLTLSNPELAAHVKSQLLDINDLYFIDPTELRTVFREIPLPSWAIGLKAAKDVTREKILKMLPSGAAEMLKQEIDLNQMVSPVKIDEEERKIIMTMRKLRDEGRITIVKTEIIEENVSNVAKHELEPETKSDADDMKTETRDERLARIKERLKKERGG